MCEHFVLLLRRCYGGKCSLGGGWTGVSACRVGPHSVSLGAILLEVNYPEGEDDNYSYVTLTCRNTIDPLSSDQTPATFWRETSQIFRSGSQLVVEVTDSTDDSISFVFNQSQEGSFSCRTALADEVSNVEKLAGRVVIQYWQYYIY